MLPDIIWMVRKDLKEKPREIQSKRVPHLWDYMTLMEVVSYGLHIVSSGYHHPVSSQRFQEEQGWGRYEKRRPLTALKLSPIDTLDTGMS